MYDDNVDKIVTKNLFLDSCLVIKFPLKNDRPNANCMQNANYIANFVKHLFEFCMLFFVYIIWLSSVCTLHADFIAH